MDSLILYINLMRNRLEPFSNSVNIDIIMEELSSIATKNWADSGNPELSSEQFDILLRRSLSKTITLN